MAKIQVSVARIDRGVNRLLRLVDTIDRESADVISGRAVRRFSGRGKAIVERLYRYALHIDAGVDEQGTAVDRAAFRAAILRLGNALKHIAMTKGDKDGKVSGTMDELGAASVSARSLARWIHVNVR